MSPYWIVAKNRMSKLLFFTFLSFYFSSSVFASSITVEVTCEDCPRGLAKTVKNQAIRFLDALAVPPSFSQTITISVSGEKEVGSTAFMSSVGSKFAKSKIEIGYPDFDKQKILSFLYHELGHVIFDGGFVQALSRKKSEEAPPYLSQATLRNMSDYYHRQSINQREGYAYQERSRLKANRVAQYAQSQELLKQRQMNQPEQSSGQLNEELVRERNNLEEMKKEIDREDAALDKELKRYNASIDKPRIGELTDEALFQILKAYSEIFADYAAVTFTGNFEIMSEALSKSYRGFSADQSIDISCTLYEEYPETKCETHYILAYLRPTIRKASKFPDKNSLRTLFSAFFYNAIRDIHALGEKSFTLGEHEFAAESQLRIHRIAELLTQLKSSKLPKLDL